MYVLAICADHQHRMLCAPPLPLGQFACLYENEHWDALQQPRLKAFKGATHNMLRLYGTGAELDDVGSWDAKPRAEVKHAGDFCLWTRLPKKVKHHLDACREAVAVFELLAMRDGKYGRHVRALPRLCVDR